MEIEEEYNQFLQDLQQYPNYFQMGTEKCSSNFWRKIAKKIEDEKEGLLKSSYLDRIKNKNMEACASYNLGDVDKAEQIIFQVLEETKSSSINACAMMAILKYRKGEITKAKRHLSCIKELAVDPYHIDVAKSELAYAYTRLDATFYKKAIALYTEAVERNPNNFPWKFGLAVIYRRCMNTFVQAIFPDLQLETCFNEAKKHLTYVLENCTDKEDRFFKARSYIELADLYSVAKTTDKLIKTDKRKIIDLINQGVQCLPKNTAVLMKAGRILRHCYKFKEAEELLQKAYNICPNSYICHQLGLAQKNRIIHQHRQSLEYPNRNQRYGANKRNQTSGSWRDHSYPPTSAPQHKANKQLDQQSKCLTSEKGSKSLKQFDDSLSSKSGKEPQINEPINVSTKALTEPKPISKPDENITNPTVHDNDLEEDLAIAEPVYQHSFAHVSPYQTTVKQLDPMQRGSNLLDRPYSQIGSPESNTEKELAETLSKVSLTNTAEAGKEPVNFLESSPSQAPPVSKMSKDFSSGPTSTIEKSELQDNPAVKMTRLINSPGNETYDLELSRKLEPCLVLFKQSAELGQERNLLVYYDWGITLLQIIPTKFDEVMEKFNHILAKDRSQFSRYRCYEQYGICKLRMSELQDLDEESREDYEEDAKEMFRRAIRCWAYCQKINLSKHFDDAEGNCKSFKSIREILLGEDSGHGTKPKRDMASLYYLVKQYGSSLSLYQEVHDELQRTSDTDMDSDIIKGIINNHLQLEQYTGILDLLALLLCSKEGLQCLEFKTDVLKHMMHYSIDIDDYQLSESVFNFQKDPNEEIDNDVLIIFNEEDQVTKKKGSTLQNWLSTFSNSGLKVIKITETAANLPGLQEQVKLICNSKMAIFILTNETPELTFLMNTALKARLDNNYFLKKIFPIVINDGMVPDIFKTFRPMKIIHQPNTADDQDKSEFLKTFSDVFLD